MNDEDVVLIAPPSSPPFTELFVWIGHHSDGSEGILSCDLEPVRGVKRHMPLMNGHRDVAERFTTRAKAIQSASQHAPLRIVRVELRRFVADRQ